MGWTEKVEFNPKEVDIHGIHHTHKNTVLCKHCSVQPEPTYSLCCKELGLLTLNVVLRRADSAQKMKKNNKGKKPVPLHRQK